MTKNMFPSDTGCCICGIKQSSSRFTSSQKYESMFPHVFLVCDRSGDFCNACVLVIKRYWGKYGRHNFLDVPDKQNWAHKVDQYSTGSRGARKKNIRGGVAAKKKVQPVHKVIKKHKSNFKKKIDREASKVYLQDGVSNPFTNPYPSIYNREYREPFDLEKAFPTIIESEVEQVTSNSSTNYHNTRSTTIITESEEEEEEVKSSFSSYPSQQSSYLSQNISYPSQNSSYHSHQSSYPSQQSSRASSPVFPTPAQTPEYHGDSSRGPSPPASSLYSSQGIPYSIEALDLSTRNSGIYNTPAPSPGESMDGGKSSRDSDDEMSILKSISRGSSKRKQANPRHKNDLPVLNNSLCTDFHSSLRIT